MITTIGEVWSDIHSNIVLDARGGIKKVTNVDSVISSIDNILRTRPGERVMLPLFGAGLADLVFEPTNPDIYDEVRDNLIRSIETWEDRVTINSVDFQVEADKNTVTIKMSFAVRGYDEIFEYSTSLVGVQ